MPEKTFTIDIKADIGRVWDEMFRRGVPHHPMFGTYLNGELTPGAVISYRSKDGRYAFVLGEVLEVEPPRRLVHTFRFSMEKDAPTLVEWEFREQSGVTRVTVTHSRFEGETRTYKAVSTSWPKILGLYKLQIERGTVPFGTKWSNGMMAAMSFMLPKSARTENAMPISNQIPS